MRTLIVKKNYNYSQPYFRSIVIIRKSFSNKNFQKGIGNSAPLSRKEIFKALRILGKLDRALNNPFKFCVIKEADNLKLQGFCNFFKPEKPSPINLNEKVNLYTRLKDAYILLGKKFQKWGQDGQNYLDSPLFRKLSPRKKKYLGLV